MTSQALFQLKPLSLSKPLVPCQASPVALPGLPCHLVSSLVALAARPVSLCSKVPVSKSLYLSGRTIRLSSLAERTISSVRDSTAGACHV